MAKLIVITKIAPEIIARMDDDAAAVADKGMLAVLLERGDALYLAMGGADKSDADVTTLVSNMVEGGKLKFLLDAPDFSWLFMAAQQGVPGIQGSVLAQCEYRVVATSDKLH